MLKSHAYTLPTKKTYSGQQLTLCKIDSLSWQHWNGIGTFTNMLPLLCNLLFLWDDFEIGRFQCCFYNCLILFYLKLRLMLHIFIVCIVYTFAIYSGFSCKKWKKMKRPKQNIFLHEFLYFIYLYICFSRYSYNVLYKIYIWPIIM